MSSFDPELTFPRMRRKEVLHWLCSIDPSTNHDAACAKHEPTTGDWFTRSQQYARWWAGNSCFLILVGIPGCGKTILCSTIEHLRSPSMQSVEVALAYFYFDFSDERKQTIDGFLSSILKQLSCQRQWLPESVLTLFEQSNDMCSRPQKAALVEALFSIAEGFQDICIVVDALDECQNRSGLASLLVEIIGSPSKNIRILGTSRREQDLEPAFQDNRCCSVSLQSSPVDEDISLHIRRRISRERRLHTWPPSVKDEIERALIRGAQGMYDLHLKPHQDLLHQLTLSR